MGQKRCGWIWPNDGKRKGAWGGVKDALTGQGPDIHVGRLDRHSKLPRSRWSRWVEFDPKLPFNDQSLPPPQHADRGLKVYDFRSRKYNNRQWKMWSNVERDSEGKVVCYCDCWGEWCCWKDPVSFAHIAPKHADWYQQHNIDAYLRPHHIPRGMIPMHACALR